MAAVSDDPSATASQLTHFNHLVSQAVGAYSNAGGQDLKNLILHESGDIQNLLKAWHDASSNDDVVHWGNVVKQIDIHYPGLDLDFFRVLGLRPAHGTYMPINSTDGDIPAYRIRNGQEYLLEVLQRTYTGRAGDSSVKSSRYMELTALDEDIHVRQPRRPVLGKYDLLSFSLYVPKQRSPGAKNLTLAMVRPAVDQRYGIELTLDLVRGSRDVLLGALSITIFAASLFAYADPPTVVSALKALPWPRIGDPPSNDTVEKFAVVIMLLSANATSFTKWIGNRGQLG
uniref:hypothetical protein n=1 Tax=Micromonospora acroterricola TaxID=2202421 RepID=UPI0011B68D08|nr:hypothetical protein [Micromonospora acroterricola]